MLRSIAHISYYTNTQHVIQNWAGYMRNRYFSLEPILAHSGGGTVGQVVRIGKSTEKTMQAFYECWFVQTYSCH